MSLTKTVRQAARDRQPLDGTDAQALEAALQGAEREVERLQRNEDIQTMLLMCFCEALELTPDDIKAPAAAAKALVLDAPSPYAPNDNVAHTPAISAIVATLRSRIAEAKAKEAP